MEDLRRSIELLRLWKPLNEGLDGTGDTLSQVYDRRVQIRSSGKQLECWPEDPLEQPFLLNVPNSNQPRGAQGDTGAEDADLGRGGWEKC